MEHNLLSEPTKLYLNKLFKEKKHDDFIKEQENKMKKAKSFFFFTPPKNSNQLQHQFGKMYEFDSGNKSFADLDIKQVSNLHYPKIEKIDYSEYNNVKFFKNDLFGKDYKDGILLVSNQKFSGNNLPSVAFELNKINTDLSDNGRTLLRIYGTNESFSNLGQINWKDKKFDKQVILYFVFPNFSKNKTFKIILKNDLVKEFIDYVRESDPVENTEDAKLFIRSKSESLFFLGRMENEKLYEHTYKHTKDKNIFLRYGYDAALIRMHNLVGDLDIETDNSIMQFKKETDNKTKEELKQIYLKEIFPYEQHFNMYFDYEKADKETLTAYHKSIFLKYIIIRFACNYKSLLDGTIINIENKSEEECLLFWYKINLFELFFNLFNEYNSKLAINPEGNIINDLNKFDKNFKIEVEPVPSRTIDFFKEKIKTDNFKYNFKEKHILQEAMDSATGYLMPYDGAFEILHDPLFNFIRFREYEDLISIVISDKNERCLIEVFDKNKVDFKYMIWNDLKQSEYHSEECIDDIYTKLATCIRDAKVLIERDSTMQYQGRRKPYGSNTNSVYHFYFPRVRYRRSDSKEQLKKEKDFFNESRNFSGTRRAHVRKLPGDSKPSKKQLLLAKQLDVWVPERHTFVQAAKWGENMTKREVRYRNTALNGIFYYDKKEMSEAQKIDQLSPPGFEEYSEKYIQKLGYEVKHKTNYDGGIDIRAVKILDNMEAEDLLVQCKHWNSPIPPGEMRDFKTACDLEETKNNKKFMFITSSRFSPGARELAEKFNIILIDGDDLITNNKKG
jgi:hypothetical protein